MTSVDESNPPAVPPGTPPPLAPPISFGPEETKATLETIIALVGLVAPAAGGPVGLAASAAALAIPLIIRLSQKLLAAGVITIEEQQAHLTRMADYMDFSSDTWTKKVTDRFNA